MHRARASGPAFARLPAGTVQSLLLPQIRDKLTALPSYHVVPGTLRAADVTRRAGAVTANGQRVEFRPRSSKRTTKVWIDDARVVQADIVASNGIIHVIDRVLMPSSEGLVGTARRAGKFMTLLAAIDVAGIADELGAHGPFTVSAPPAAGRSPTRLTTPRRRAAAGASAVASARSDERHPVDGGVFDIPAGATEVVVPITAKLAATRRLSSPSR